MITSYSKAIWNRFPQNHSYAQILSFCIQTYIENLTHVSSCKKLGIRGALRNEFPKFLGFGFGRKFVRMKTQQGTDKLIKHKWGTA